MLSSIFIKYIKTPYIKVFYWLKCYVINLLMLSNAN